MIILLLISISYGSHQCKEKDREVKYCKEDKIVCAYTIDDQPYQYDNYCLACQNTLIIKYENGKCKGKDLTVTESELPLMAYDFGTFMAVALGILIFYITYSARFNIL